MSFRLRISNSRMARTILIDCEGLESEKKKKHAGPLEIHEVWGCTLPRRWRLFSHSPVGRKKLFSKLVCTWRSNCSWGPFEEMWCADIEKWVTDLAVEGLLFVKVSTKLDIHQFAHWLSRWPAGLVRDRSAPSSIRRERSNKTKLPNKKGLIVLGKDASVGWFVSGYVRLLQSQAAFTRIQISGYLDIRMSKIRISWERLHVSDRNVFGVYTSPDIRMHYTRHLLQHARTTFLSHMHTHTHVRALVHARTHIQNFASLNCFTFQEKKSIHL